MQAVAVYLGQGELMSFRRIIQRQVKQRGISGYRLAKMVGPEVASMRMIQAYLAGEADMTGERLAAICKALGLELRTRKKGR